MLQRIWQGGMIGAGAWSVTQLEAWSSVRNAKIVALADRHPERRGPVASQFSVAHEFHDVAAMLDGVTLDFVDVCTRPYSHAALTKLAADRGLPVLCQKPFCTTMDEARAAVDYCRQVRVPLMINENFRWQAWYRKARELLRSGALGRPFLATMHSRRRLSLPRFDHYQTYFKEMPLLLLYEVGTHLLDVTRFLFGEPETIYARLHHLSPDVKGEDVEAITVGYPDLTCLIYDSWASVPIPEIDEPGDQRKWYPRLLEIDGTEATLSLTASGELRLFTDADHQSWAFPADTPPRAHTAAQQHFIDCLESGAEFETSGEETLKTMTLVYAGYRSAEEGRVVRPDELLA